MAVSKVVSGIIASVKAAKDGSGQADIKSKDVAKLVKAQLAIAFPGFKFSVKSDYSSVDVYWTDGPTAWEVDQVIKQYKFGGFDGSIDMAYGSRNWLLPDGTMSFAQSSGTSGSGGYIQGGATDCPVPGAVLVSSGVKYVFSHRTISDDRMGELVAKVEAYYGFKVPEGVKPWNHNVEELGEWASALAMRHETSIAKQVADLAASV
jgi:hypothetical protein